MKVLDDASYVKDDPVRPSLSYAFRKSVGEIFYIGEDKPDVSFALHIHQIYPQP